MTFFIGSRSPLEKIIFNKGLPSFHTRDLTQDEQVVAQNFSASSILYMGSDQGCGCGFKHSLLDKEGVWYDVVEEGEAAGSDSVANQKSLVEYLKGNIPLDEKIEIFCCWDGNQQQKPQWVEQVSLDDLANKNFYFKENGFYVVHQ